MRMRTWLCRGRALLVGTAAVAVGIASPVEGGGDSAAGPGNSPGTAHSGKSGNGGGGSHETVTMGGKTWMKRNLNIETANSWCYRDDTANCAKYGRLYTHEAAKSACQSLGNGWRLPNRADWDALAKAAGGKKHFDYETWHGWLDAGKYLKSVSGWVYCCQNRTDEFGFSALPGGYRGTDGSFHEAGIYGDWWTAEEDVSGNAYYRYIYGTGDDVLYEHAHYKSNAFSARCVRDVRQFGE